MPQLSVFTSISVDGYFTDEHGDMSWAHKADDEWNAFVADNASGGGALVFGRITYEQMASFWPTPAATKMNARVAERMNAMPKYVLSKTLEDVSWRNTRLLKSLEKDLRALKKKPGGEDMVILGSGSIVAQATQAGLVDQYTLVVTPIVLGAGRPLFEGVEKKLPLELTSTRSFRNGNVVLTYVPL